MAENNRLPDGKRNEKAPSHGEAVVKKAERDEPLGGFGRAVPIILTALAVFIGLSFIIDGLGVLGTFFRNGMMGLFSSGAYAAPVLLLVHAVFYRSDIEKRRILSRIIFSLVALVFISVAIYTVQNWHSDSAFMGGEYYSLGQNGVGGGLVGSTIAFALIKLFDYVGVIIIAAAMLAIYLTYFFSAGKGTLKSIGFSLLKGIVITLAAIERGIKRIFGSSSRSAKTKKKKKPVKKPIGAQKKNAKSTAKKPRKASKHRDKLYEDEFFGVNNGIESLEIPELGIREERSRESIESCPTLQEKVHRKSDVKKDDLETEVKNDKVKEEKESYYETIDFSEPVKKGKSIDRDFGLDDDFKNVTIEDEPIEAVKDDEPEFDFGAKSFDTYSEKSAPVYTDSADAVFTSAFDPFSFSNAEALANKPSSKCSPTEGASCRENIHEITEEDVERARRNAHFERRKEMLVKAERERAERERRAAEAREAEQRAAENTASAPQNEPTDTNPTSYAEARGYEEKDTVRNPYNAQNTEAAPSVTETYGSQNYRESCNERETVELPREEKRVEYHTPTYTPPTVREESATSITVEKSGQPRYNEIRYTESDSTTYGRRFEAEPEAVQSEAPSYIERESYAEPETVLEIFSDTHSANSEDTSYLAEKDYAPIGESIVETVFESDGNRGEDEPVSYFSTAPVTEEESAQAETDDGEITEFVFEDNEAKTGLVFEFDGELPEEKTDNILEVERTRLSYDGSEIEAANFDSDEEDAEEERVITADTDDGEFDDDEIPPEKQNPAINSYRDMFSMFRSAPTEESREDTESIAEEVKETEDGEDEEELDLPFERPTSYNPVSSGVINESPRPYVPKEDTFVSPFSGIVKAAETKQKEEKEETPKKKTDYSNYKLPPLDLLTPGKPQNDDEINVEIKQNTTTLIETLASFNVTASIKGVDRGPRITRYEVVPARGVKVQAITGLFDDIALNLAAEGIRMEAPIPGKSAIGFEIPNKNPTNVTLRELLECEEFVNAKSKTFVCIGKDVAGNPVFGDIAKFPHALVAGATGMGKSVCINSVMISMLYKARPDEVKFIMIDPKKVEFRMYSGIPHLLIPVITEAKQAAGALMWAVEEMERRYGIIEQLNIRNIEAYNEKCAVDKSIGEPMPKIVIVIDELNDLMMQVRDPVEDLIMRIAQKARAAGIHLIIGTQRPDVKVVTGTIKANINTRISCKVSSLADSRTILDMAGAEKLLNRGDMLFKPVDKPKPIRVQGCFVSDPEVEAIMDFLKSECDGNVYDDEVFAEINRAAQKCGNKKSGGADDDGDDDGGEVGYYSDQQFLDAVELAIRSGKVSTSLLQRKLSIGYGKAAKFIDAMEDIGIVSEQNGQKPRDVLISLDEWHEKLSRVNFDE